MSQWASDATINRPNLMLYLSLTYNRDSWAYRYMQQTIHDTSMVYTDTCTIVIDILNIGRTGVLVDGIHSLEPQQNRLLCRHKGACNSTPIPYLDEDGGTTATRWLSRCFYITFAFLSMNEKNNPQHIDCGRSTPATYEEWIDCRLSGASSGIVLSPMSRRYRSTTV